MTPTSQTVPPRRTDDLQLVQRVLAGDALALEDFIQRMSCVPAILAHRNSRNHRLLNDHDLADLGQEVVTAIWQRLSAYRGHGALESWVYPFCIQHYVNAARRGQRRPLHEDVHQSVDLTDPRPEVEQQLALSDLIYRHLNRLEQVQADVISARHFDCMTFEQIAERFDLPLTTAKTHYRRGLDLLRTYLGPHMTEGMA